MRTHSVAKWHAPPERLGTVPDERNLSSSPPLEPEHNIRRLNQKAHLMTLPIEFDATVAELFVAAKLEEYFATPGSKGVSAEIAADISWVAHTAVARRRLCNDLQTIVVAMVFELAVLKDTTLAHAEDFIEIVIVDILGFPYPDFEEAFGF